jgi:hypothetical protein
MTDNYRVFYNLFIQEIENHITNSENREDVLSLKQLGGMNRGKQRAVNTIC